MKESKQMPLKIGRCPFSPICSKYFQRIEYRTPISVWSLHGQFRYIRTRSMSTVSEVTSSKSLLFAESSFGFGPCKNQRFLNKPVHARWSNLSKMAQRNQSGDFSNRPRSSFFRQHIDVLSSVNGRHTIVFRDWTGKWNKKELAL